MTRPAREPAPSRRLRVVHLIGQLGQGGSEQQLHLVLAHLDPARFDSRVIAFNRSPEGELHRTLEELGVGVEYLPASCRGIARRTIHLTRALRRRRPDVIHSWTAHDNPYAELAGRLAGVPARFGSLRTTLESTLMHEKSALHRWLMLHGSRRLVVNSETCAAELAAAGIGRQRVRLLRNCVEVDGDAQDSGGEAADLAEHGVAPHHRLVGLVANLRRVKNHLFFVDAMARVLPEHSAARVLLVGQPLPSEPELPARIRERIAGHGLADRFILTGFRGDVPALLRRMEVCCLASKSEGMPNVVLEAMAAGRPVVATRVGGVPELVSDGETGLLVELGDTGAFAAAVSRLLADPELARRMGRAGRRRAARRHSCAEAVRRLEEIYRQALPSRGGRR